MPKLAAIGEWLLDLVYPPRCLGCGTAGQWLCPACLSACPPAANPRHVPVEDARNRWTLPVHSFAIHQGLAREAVHGLKYDGKRVLAEPMARQMEGCLPRDSLKVDVVLAVPLHEQRRRDRGYNQSELLARAIARDWGLESPASSLIRVRETPPQVGLSAQERVRNVKGAFLADGRQVSGRAVLLVDDVCTTGATIAACAAAIAAAGGTVVAGVTFTRAREGADS